MGEIRSIRGLITMTYEIYLQQTHPLIAIAQVVLLGFFIYFLYQLFLRPLKNHYWINDRVDTIQVVLLRKIADKRGINVDKELHKLEKGFPQNKSFNKQLEEEMKKEFFGEDKKEDGE